MLKLFIKDRETGVVHEYGTNPHDSLIVHSDGSLSYYNLQTSEGTMFGAYCFCDKDGNDLTMEGGRDNESGSDNFFDIAETEDESMSKLFRDVIGENLVLGIGKGFSDTMDDVTDEMAAAMPTELDVSPALNLVSGDSRLQTVTANLINAWGDNIMNKLHCFLSELVRDLSRIVDDYRKQGYTDEEIKAILTAPDEEEETE